MIMTGVSRPLVNLPSSFIYLLHILYGHKLSEVQILKPTAATIKIWPTSVNVVVVLVML